MRQRTLLLTRTSGWLVAVVTLAYLVAAAVLALPTWSWVLALLVGGTGAISLLVMHQRVQKDPDRATAAVPRWGDLIVQGDLDHVRQQCLVALVGLGARIVEVQEDRLLACTGLRFFTPEMFLGEVIWVTLSPEDGDATAVRIASVKVDYVSRSRSAKNVARFLDAWATHPAYAA